MNMPQISPEYPPALTQNVSVHLSIFSVVAELYIKQILLRIDTTAEARQKKLPNINVFLIMKELHGYANVHLRRYL
jgi:hypothetical protein